MATATVHQLSARQLSKAADNLGAYKAALRNIQQRIASIEAMLEEHGVGEYVGKNYRAVVSYCDETMILDQAKAKSLLTPAQLVGCMKTKAGYWKTTVKEV